MKPPFYDSIEPYLELKEDNVGIVTGILGKIFQLKVSVIGFKSIYTGTYGNPNATHKLIEVSVALLTFGFRAVLKV